MKQTIKNLSIVTISYLIFYILNKIYHHFHSIELFVNENKSYMIEYLTWWIITGIPFIIGTYLINKKANIFNDLGLNSNFLKGIIFASIFVLPMFIGGFCTSKINYDNSIENLITKTFLVGFFEEVFFRGFLFGQIYKNTKLGFIPSALFGAVLFGFGHLCQSHDFIGALSVFGVTFLGAILFSWLYIEWNYNLWIPIFLHALMNMCWFIFDFGNNAAGNSLSNVFRVSTILLSIIITLYYKKRHNLRIMIDKKKIW